MAQSALAWVLSLGGHVVALPGTTRIEHLEENIGAEAVTLGTDTLPRLDALINRHTVHGARYNPATQAEVDTEEFA